MLLAAIRRESARLGVSAQDSPEWGKEYIMKILKQKRAITAIAIILALVIAAVVWLSVAGVKNTNPICLFGHDYGEDNKCTRCGAEKPADDTETPVTAIDNDGNVMDSDKVYAMPKGIAFASANSVAATPADSSVTIKATVTPTDATNAKLNWTVEWVSDTSDFAAGKAVTDYVTVTSSSDSHTATIKCLQPFGEQISVKATAQSNPNASASCTVDYIKRVTGIKSFDVLQGFTFTTNTCTYEAETTPYTIDVETVISIDSIHLFDLFVTDIFPDKFKAYCEEIGEYFDESFYDDFGQMFVNEDFSISKEDWTFDASTMELTFAYNSFSALFLQVGQNIHEADPIFDGAYYKLLQEYPYTPGINVTVKTVLNGTVISSVTKEFQPDVNLSEFYVQVSNVSLSQSGIRF